MEKTWTRRRMLIAVLVGVFILALGWSKSHLATTRFYFVKLGQSRAEVLKIMGEPRVNGLSHFAYGPEAGSFDKVFGFLRPFIPALLPPVKQNVVMIHFGEDGGVDRILCHEAGIDRRR